MRELRESLGKRSSYALVSKRLNETGRVVISPSAIHRYEQGGRVPDVITLAALADLYQVPRYEMFDRLVTELFGYEDQFATADRKQRSPAVSDQARSALEDLAVIALDLLSDATGSSPGVPVDRRDPRTLADALRRHRARR